MDVPDLARDRLGDESVVGGVDLDGDAVLVTPTRTLVYREEGLLSDESIAEFPHDAERVELREGRRKATFRYAYIDGTRDFSVPAGRVEDLLAPLLWGVLHAAGVIGGDETVRGAYRFSELTFVVAGDRAVKHVGGALWDGEFEQFPYADLTDLDFEEGSVATAIVFEVDGRRERVKAPNDRAGVVRRAVEEAVLEFHGVDSLDAFREAVDPDDGSDEEASGTGGFDTGGFEPLVDDGSDEVDDGSHDGVATGGEGDGVATGSEGGDVADASGGGLAEASGSSGTPAGSSGGGASGSGESGSDARSGVDAGSAGSGTAEDADAGAAAAGSPAAPTPHVEDEERVAEQLAALTEAVRRQNELLERQRATIEQLVEELRRGR